MMAAVSARETYTWLSRYNRPAMTTSTPMAEARSAAAEAPASMA